jgi:Transposase DDE domain
VDALGTVHERVLRQESRARQACGLLVVDCDQCGLVANGQTYEFHRKGYFPRQRGAEGYQVSLAYIGAYEEAVALYLDPGNVHCKSRLSDLLRATDRLFGPDEMASTLIRRLDAGYDSADNRATLAAAPGYVVLKGADNALAARLARDVPVQHWHPITDTVHGTEVAPAAPGLRRLVYEVHQADGTVAYARLYTTVPAAAWSVGRLFAFYNERTTIEAFFCQSRHVYNIPNLRSRQFHAIYAFVRFVVLTHNLLVWAKQARLAPTELVAATTRQLVQHIARVRAHIAWDGRWHIRILRPRAPSSPWAALLIQALTRPPHLVQLPLPFARLHKT